MLVGPLFGVAFFIVSLCSSLVVFGHMKIHEILIFFSALFIAVFVILLGNLFTTTNVRRIADHYTYFDKKRQEYVVSKVKPDTWVDLKNVSKYAQWAIIVSEDWAFYDHEGLDLRQLEIVLKESWEQKTLTRGASTISQQLVKNALLTDERSVWRKFKEMLLTIYVEKLISKDRILELYLNIIELGDGIYGVREGARHYFSKHPKDLTAREGAFLAMLLPSPVKYSISFREKKLTEFANGQVNSILIKMRQAGILTREEQQAEAAKKFYWEQDANAAPAYEQYLQDSYL